MEGTLLQKALHICQHTIKKISWTTLVFAMIPRNWLRASPATSLSPATMSNSDSSSEILSTTNLS
jgi:hypothetical protein